MIDNRTIIMELLLQARGSLLAFWLGQTTFYTAWLTNERWHRDGVQAFKGLTTIRQSMPTKIHLYRPIIDKRRWGWGEAVWTSAPSSWRTLKYWYYRNLCSRADGDNESCIDRSRNAGFLYLRRTLKGVVHPKQNSFTFKTRLTFFLPWNTNRENVSD